MDTATQSIPFYEDEGDFTFNNYLDVEWDDNNNKKIIKEKWTDNTNDKTITVKRVLKYPENVYRRQRLKPFGKGANDKNLTSLGDEVFMEWTPHLFTGKNESIIDNYINDFKTNPGKKYKEKIIINNEIQSFSGLKRLPRGQTWWDVNDKLINGEENPETMDMSEDTFEIPTQYYVDTEVLDLVNKLKETEKHKGLLWINQENEYQKTHSQDKDNISNQDTSSATTSSMGNDGTFVPIHKRKNFRNRVHPGDNESGNYVPLHLRRKLEANKYSIKLYNFTNLDGVDGKDILDWVRGYDVMGYIKITIPKSRRTGKLCSFVFLNFKTENDKSQALEVLLQNKLKFNHSIISVEDASKMDD